MGSRIGSSGQRPSLYQRNHPTQLQQPSFATTTYFCGITKGAFGWIPTLPDRGTGSHGRTPDPTPEIHLPGYHPNLSQIKNAHADGGMLGRGRSPGTRRLRRRIELEDRGIGRIAPNGWQGDGGEPDCVQGFPEDVSRSAYRLEASWFHALGRLGAEPGFPSCYFNRNL